MGRDEGFLFFLFLFAMHVTCAMSCQQQSAEHEYSVEHEQFVTKFVSSEMISQLVYDETYYRRTNTDVWHKLVVDAAFRQYAVGKQSE